MDEHNSQMKRQIEIKTFEETEKSQRDLRTGRKEITEQMNRQLDRQTIRYEGNQGRYINRWIDCRSTYRYIYIYVYTYIYI